MTKKEKAKIEEAIQELHAEGNYHKGMKILCDLVGWTFPAAEGKVETITLDEALRRARGETETKTEKG